MDTPIAYTFSPLLHSLTSSIDQYHTHILTIPLLPRKETALRTLATQNRILTALSEARIPMTAPELSRLLNNPPKRPHPIEQEALLYRQALSYIRDEWTGISLHPAASHIEVLMHISLPQSFRNISRIIDATSTDITKLLSYMHVSNDHPVILAGITHAFMTQSALHSTSKGRITSLLTSLILARSGYDARGMLTHESTLINDRKAYAHALASITAYGQMTIWLEYFTTCVLEAYKALEVRVQQSNKLSVETTPNLLNDRQKQILLLLDTYGAKITNREVQKRFRVSQITASRDLTKLVSGGFITSRGKGRSVSYSIA